MLNAIKHLLEPFNPLLTSFKNMDIERQRELHNQGGADIPAVQQAASSTAPVHSRPTTADAEQRLPTTSSSTEKLEYTESPDRGSLHRGHPRRGLSHSGPLPTLPHARLQDNGARVMRSRTIDTHMSGGLRSGIDWIVPMDEKVRMPDRKPFDD